MYRSFVKRGLDIIVSLAGIIALSPLLLIIAVLVRIYLGSPVLFSQDRPGLHGKIFKLYKFRSMTNRTDADGNLLPDSERLPRFGRILRSTSLDELPELWNILKGDMSVVGPRPLLVEYLPLYSEEQSRRHDVRSGLTGLAQVNGRNAITWEQRLKLDCRYVDNQSFLLDLRIIFLTVLSVFSRRGINASGSVTMERFTGTGKED